MRVWGVKEYIAVKTGKAKSRTSRKILSAIISVLYILLIPVIPFVLMYLSLELKFSTASVVVVGLMMVAALYFLWRLLVRVNMARFAVFIKDDIGFFRVILGSSNSLKLKDSFLIDRQLDLIDDQFRRARESGGEIDVTQMKDVPVIKIVEVTSIDKHLQSYTIVCTVLHKNKRQKKRIRIRNLVDIESLIHEFERIKGI